MVSLSASELDSCVACIQPGRAVQFIPHGTVSSIVPIDYNRFTDVNYIVYGFFFAPGDFSALETYTTY